MTDAQNEARAIEHPLSDVCIERLWPGADPIETRVQFDALMKQLKMVWHRSFPHHRELFAQVTADKAQELPQRIAALETALAGLPAHWQQWQWYAVPKPVFGEREVRSVYGDNGHGMGRQIVAAVPADRHYFGTVADFIAAANPDTIRMLLAALAAKDAEIERLTGQLAEYEALVREAGEVVGRARQVIDAASEELRLIRSKDSGAVYDTTLRHLDIPLALQASDAFLDKLTKLKETTDAVQG